MRYEHFPRSKVNSQTGGICLSEIPLLSLLKTVNHQQMSRATTIASFMREK